MSLLKEEKRKWAARVSTSFHLNDHYIVFTLKVRVKRSIGHFMQKVLWKYFWPSFAFPFQDFDPAILLLRLQTAFLMMWTSSSSPDREYNDRAEKDVKVSGRLKLTREKKRPNSFLSHWPFLCKKHDMNMVLNTRDTDFAPSDRLLWKFSWSKDLSCQTRSQAWRFRPLPLLFHLHTYSSQQRQTSEDTHGLLMQQRDGKLHEETGNWGGGRCQKVDYKKHSEKLSVCSIRMPVVVWWVTQKVRGESREWEKVYFACIVRESRMTIDND